MSQLKSTKYDFMVRLNTTPRNWFGKLAIFQPANKLLQLFLLRMMVSFIQGKESSWNIKQMLHLLIKSAGNYFFATISFVPVQIPESHSSHQRVKFYLTRLLLPHHKYEFGLLLLIFCFINVVGQDCGQSECRWSRLAAYVLNSLQGSCLECFFLRGETLKVRI